MNSFITTLIFILLPLGFVFSNDVSRETQSTNEAMKAFTEKFPPHLKKHLEYTQEANKNYQEVATKALRTLSKINSSELSLEDFVKNNEDIKSVEDLDLKLASADNQSSRNITKPAFCHKVGEMRMFFMNRLMKAVFELASKIGSKKKVVASPVEVGIMITSTQLIGVKHGIEKMAKEFDFLTRQLAHFCGLEQKIEVKHSTLKDLYQVMLVFNVEFDKFAEKNLNFLNGKNENPYSPAKFKWQE